MKQKSSYTPRIILSVVAVLSILSDYATKELALKYLEPGVEQPLVGEFITLKLIFNPGAAFSFLANSTWVFTVFSVLVVGVIGYYGRKIMSPWWAFALGLLGGGAIGNLIDRLLRPPAVGSGHVVDFLNWNNWFIGNVADIWIVAAAGLIFLLVILNHPAHPQEPKAE